MDRQAYFDTQCQLNHGDHFRVNNIHELTSKSLIYHWSGHASLLMLEEEDGAAVGGAESGEGVAKGGGGG